jgi:hypothetical protein
MPSPWKKVTYLAVGGLTEVGFAAGSLLLVVSHQGRGVVDLASGNVLARDRQETGAWFDAARRAALGIGPLDGTWIGVCGLVGPACSCSPSAVPVPVSATKVSRGTTARLRAACTLRVSRREMLGEGQVAAPLMARRAAHGTLELAHRRL